MCSRACRIVTRFRSREHGHMGAANSGGNSEPTRQTGARRDASATDGDIV